MTSVQLYRLMQRHRLTEADLARLTGYKPKRVKAWIRGIVPVPSFVKAVIENQKKYVALLPREFRRVALIREKGQRKFQRVLPPVE
jgi:hypothetical protein